MEQHNKAIKLTKLTDEQCLIQCRKNRSTSQKVSAKKYYQGNKSYHRMYSRMFARIKARDKKIYQLEAQLESLKNQYKNQ